ncbi:Hypothetical predicted protein [Olea europaea subsp. europaea]|uniref:Uncharacterized protein n=1 Tax=Olea europaea subsp. europaea TaxID=158383 RepID=A0A8S0PLG4_OLEEU|nr:Hypothetical predicted protein [Olea europaea subsp. europaea]
MIHYANVSHKLGYGHMYSYRNKLEMENWPMRRIKYAYAALSNHCPTSGHPASLSCPHKLNSKLYRKPPEIHREFCYFQPAETFFLEKPRSCYTDRIPL